MPLPLQTLKIKRFLAREEVRSKLESWIVEGTLRPEEILNDKQIALAFGVSRMPVREALRSLEDKGLVETSLNRWTRVAPLRLDEARNLYALVATLEDLALRTMYPHFKEVDIAALQLADAELSNALASRDAIAASRADSAFHSVWVRGAANPQLERAANECRTKLMRIEIAHFRSPENLSQSLDEHSRILKALVYRDLNEALQELQRHWQASVQRCLSGIVSGTESTPAMQQAV